jgi:peptide deformylase
MRIVNYPHPVLRAKSTPIQSISKELHLIAGNMLELMYKHEGLGLAGPQVDYPHQIIVMNFSGKPEETENECVAINPVVLESKGSIDDREGCLSFPDLYAKVKRAKTVKVQAYNLKGELFEMTCTDLAARLWLHEIDHLQGNLFIDKMGLIGRMNSRKDLDHFIREFEEDKKKGLYPTDLIAKL